MEYKFRGKRKDNGEWAYGLLVMGVFNDTMIQTNENGFHHTVVVTPETVGMWTGLKDIEGKDIYQGDIVLTKKYWKWPHSVRKRWKRFHGEVVFLLEENAGMAEWFVKVEDTEDYDREFFGPFNDCKVISSIYDAPHLLTPSQKGDVSNTMNNNLDPKEGAAEQATEQVAGENAQESAAQDQATGADSEEGSIEG